jgi:hypothetical protein
MTTTHIFLDIDIGDAAQHAADAAAFQRGVAFLQQAGAQYGLTGDSPAQLDAEGQQLLLESYAADPAWSSQGVSLCAACRAWHLRWCHS